MNISIDRKWFCVEIESTINRWSCSVGVWIKVFNRVFFREWSLLVECPACEGGDYYYDYYYIDDHCCPVCHKEGYVWPTGWLKYHVSRILWWSSLPYHLWVNRPADDYAQMLQDARWDEIHRQY